MAKFDINKKGYDTHQVDNFINKLTLKYEEKLSEQKDRVFSLKNELSIMQERVDSFKDKDQQISQALIYAVEKAEQIEGNASKLYDLEVKRLKLLYTQWQELIGKLKEHNIPEEILSEIGSFSKTISEVLDQNSRIGGNMIRKDLHKNSNNYIKNILNRMDYEINSKPKQPTKPSFSQLSAETERESNRMRDLSAKLDKIRVKGSGNMADNYLNSEEEDLSSVFARTITRKTPKKKDTSGFNLEDALNPKEDLDEIMRAFDFFIEQNEED